MAFAQDLGNAQAELLAFDRGHPLADVPGQSGDLASPFRHFCERQAYPLPITRRLPGKR